MADQQDPIEASRRPGPGIYVDGPLTDAQPSLFETPTNAEYRATGVEQFITHTLNKLRELKVNPATITELERCLIGERSAEQGAAINGLVTAANLSELILQMQISRDGIASAPRDEHEKACELLGALYFIHKVVDIDPGLALDLEHFLSNRGEHLDIQKLRTRLDEFYEARILGLEAPHLESLAREFKGENSVAETNLLAGALYGLLDVEYPGFGERFGKAFRSFVDKLGLLEVPKSIADLDDEPLPENTIKLLKRRIDAFKTHQKEREAEGRSRTAGELEIRRLESAAALARAEADATAAKQQIEKSREIQARAAADKAVSEADRARAETARIAAKERLEASRATHAREAAKKATAEAERARAEAEGAAATSSRPIFNRELPSSASGYTAPQPIRESFQSNESGEGALIEPSDYNIKEKKAGDLSQLTYDPDSYRSRCERWKNRIAEASKRGFSFRVSTEMGGLIFNSNEVPKDWINMRSSEGDCQITVPAGLIRITDNGWGDGYIVFERTKHVTAGQIGEGDRHRRMFAVFISAFERFNNDVVPRCP